MNILREFFFQEKESCYIPLLESKRKKKRLFLSLPILLLCIWRHYFWLEKYEFCWYYKLYVCRTSYFMLHSFSSLFLFLCFSFYNLYWPGFKFTDTSFCSVNLLLNPAPKFLISDIFFAGIECLFDFLFYSFYFFVKIIFSSYCIYHYLCLAILIIILKSLSTNSKLWGIYVSVSISYFCSWLWVIFPCFFTCLEICGYIYQILHIFKKQKHWSIFPQRTYPFLSLAIRVRSWMYIDLSRRCAMSAQWVCFNLCMFQMFLGWNLCYVYCRHIILAGQSTRQWRSHSLSSLVPDILQCHTLGSVLWVRSCRQEGQALPCSTGSHHFHSY